MFMMSLVLPAASIADKPEQTLEPLDPALLEFLGSYDAENADLFDIAVEEINNENQQEDK